MRDIICYSSISQNKTLPADQQMISALPDIKHITITPEDEFMVLACDGIWNFMTSEDVVEFVQERMKKNLKMSQICEEVSMISYSQTKIRNALLFFSENITKNMYNQME